MHKSIAQTAQTIGLQTTETIAVALIHDKLQALRQQVTWLEDLEQDLQSAVEDPQVQAQTPATAAPQVNLRDVVRDILLNAEGGRLKRKDIIERVRLRHPHVAPIGVVSTLAARKVFKKVDGDSFELRGKRQAVDTHTNGVPPQEGEQQT